MRLTQTKLEEARKMLTSWQEASKEIGENFDIEFKMREIAGILGVDFAKLKKRLLKE